MMIRQVTQINWRYIGDVVPSFVVLTFIPFSYSVAYGLIAGVFVYAVLNGAIGLVVILSGGRIEPREYDLKEYWTWKGSGRPPWFIRAIKSRCQPNRYTEQDDLVEDSRTGSSAKDEPIAIAERAVLPREVPDSPQRWAS
jgi:AGZA family xanthine/uracil permease-like MFS transporter